jgi:UDP-N-acetylmuramoyl-tripeptide--D-alanyl-D-alanine ligase
MNTSEIASALSSVACPPQRGEVLRFKDGFTVINDSYNSNPDALLSMVSTLISGAAASERKIVIAGEMLELGSNAAKMHRETGRAIGKSGVDILIGVRGLASELVTGSIEGGVSEAIFAEDAAEAGEILASKINAGDVVLVKGSRGVRTEKVVEILLSRFESATENAGAA